MRNFTRQVFVLAISLLASMQASAYDFEADGMYYNVTSTLDLTAEITSGDNKYSGDVVIPETVIYRGRTLTVTGIGDYAFGYCRSLKSITIPNSVTEIGSDAFSRCSSLKSITIPNSVTKIGSYAFSQCSSLESVTIPNSVTVIESSAFEECSSLESVTIPNSVTVIESSAFSRCSSLESVTIPNSVYKIERFAFRSCSKLNSFTLGSGVYDFPSYFTSHPTETYYGIFISNNDDPVPPITKFYIADSPKALYIGKTGGTYSNEYYEINKLPIKELYIGRPIEVTFDEYYYKDDDMIRPASLEKIELGGCLKSDDFINYYEAFELPDSCKTIVYGDSIERISHPIESASEIYLKCPTPPQTEEWSIDNYLNTIVYVPKGTLSDYQAADVWKNFWEIKEWDVASDISTPTQTTSIAVTADGRQITIKTGGQRLRVMVYNAGGNLIYDGNENTVNVNDPGLYIVRAGSLAKKLLIK